MRKKKNMILCLLGILLLSACASSSKTYQLQALNQYQNEETDAKILLTFTYNEDREVVMYTSEETYQSSDEVTIDDYLQRVKRSQTIMSQIDGANVQADVGTGRVALNIEIPFDTVEVADVLKNDANFNAYVKDEKLNIDVIKKYLTAQGYSLFEEEVK